MGFKIRLPNEVVVETETVTELRAALETLGYSGQALPSTDSESSGGSKATKLTRFWHRLGSENQRRVLLSLAERPTGMTDRELRELLGFKNNNELAGVLGAVGRNAKAVGATYDDVVSWQWKGEDYLYRLTQEMSDVLSLIRAEEGS